MADLTQNAPYPKSFLMVLSSDHITGATGLSPLPAVQISKAGGAFNAPAGVVTELGFGWYSVAFTSADTNTLGDLAFHASAAGCDATDEKDQVKTFAPGRGAPLSNFEFPMLSNVDHTSPATGLTVSVQVSKDGGAFAPSTNTAAEVGSGNYAISLTASEMSASVVALRMTATGADPQRVTIVTSP